MDINYWNNHINTLLWDENSLDFLWIIDKWEIRKQDWKVTKTETLLLKNFFTQWKWIAPYFHSSIAPFKNDKKKGDSTQESKNPWITTWLLSIVWWYGICHYWNNVLIQESQIYRTLKLPWWKATSKEFVYALTDLRQYYKENNLHDIFKCRTPSTVFATLSEFRKKEIINSDVIVTLDDWNKKLADSLDIFSIYWTRLDALYAATTQEAEDKIKEIWNKYGTSGKEFLIKQFNKVMNEEQQKLFSLKEHIIDSTNENPRTAFLRELKEESWYTWCFNDNTIVWIVGEIKNAKSNLPLIKHWTALKFRILYDFQCWEKIAEIQESPSEVDQELILHHNTSLVDILIKTVDYTLLKLWTIDPINPYDDSAYIEAGKQIKKINSQLANQALCVLWFFDQYKKWRIPPADYDKFKNYFHLETAQSA